MVLMQQAEINLIGPPLPMARVGRWSDGTGMTTEWTFELRHDTSTPAGGVVTSLKLLRVGDSGRQSDHRPGLFQLLCGVHRKGCALHRECGDGEASLDQTELLETFQIFER